MQVVVGRHGARRPPRASARSRRSTSRPSSPGCCRVSSRARRRAPSSSSDAAALRRAAPADGAGEAGAACGCCSRAARRGRADGAAWARRPRPEKPAAGSSWRGSTPRAGASTRCPSSSSSRAAAAASPRRSCGSSGRARPQAFHVEPASDAFGPGSVALLPRRRGAGLDRFLARSWPGSSCARATASRMPLVSAAPSGAARHERLHRPGARSRRTASTSRGCSTRRIPGSGRPSPRGRRGRRASRSPG